MGQIFIFPNALEQVTVQSRLRTHTHHIGLMRLAGKPCLTPSIIYLLHALHKQPEAKTTTKPSRMCHSWNPPPPPASRSPGRSPQWHPASLPTSVCAKTQTRDFHPRGQRKMFMDLDHPNSNRWFPFFLPTKTNHNYDFSTIDLVKGKAAHGYRLRSTRTFRYPRLFGWYPV